MKTSNPAIDFAAFEILASMRSPNKIAQLRRDPRKRIPGKDSLLQFFGVPMQAAAERESRGAAVKRGTGRLNQVRQLLDSREFIFQGVFGDPPCAFAVASHSTNQGSFGEVHGLSPQIARAIPWNGLRGLQAQAGSRAQGPRRRTGSAESRTQCYPYRYKLSSGGFAMRDDGTGLL